LWIRPKIRYCNTEENDRFDKMIVFSVLTTVMTLVYVSLVIPCREEGRSIFLEIDALFQVLRQLASKEVNV